MSTQVSPLALIQWCCCSAQSSPRLCLQLQDRIFPCCWIYHHLLSLVMFVSLFFCRGTLSYFSNSVGMLWVPGDLLSLSGQIAVKTSSCTLRQFLKNGMVCSGVLVEKGIKVFSTSQGNFVWNHVLPSGKWMDGYLDHLCFLTELGCLHWFEFLVSSHSFCSVLTALCTSLWASCRSHRRALDEGLLKDALCALCILSSKLRMGSEFSLNHSWSSLCL